MPATDLIDLDFRYHIIRVLLVILNGIFTKFTITVIYINLIYVWGCDVVYCNYTENISTFLIIMKRFF